MALIPSDRLRSWEPSVDVGILGAGGIAQYLPGGVYERTTLIDVTQAPYNADNTGAVDCSSAIQDAILDAKAANNGSVVWLPAGTYLVESGGWQNGSGINNGSNFTIRGAGMGVTNIIWENPTPTTGTLFSFGVGSAWDYPPSDNSTTSGLAAGATTITIPDASPFSVGQLMRLTFENEEDDTEIEGGAVPVFSPAGAGNVRAQCVRITGVNTTTDVITFTPAVLQAQRAGLTTTVHMSQFPMNSVGIEDLSVDAGDTEPYAIISITDAYNCWVKGVEVAHSLNYAAKFSNAINCEIRESWLRDGGTGGSNGAGLFTEWATCLLAEDNIITNLAPCTEFNYNTVGSAFLYNYVGGANAFNINHGPHNSFNLYEGNHGSNMKDDGYHGGSSYQTIFRNWISGLSTSGDQTFTLSFKRFGRYHSFVGNLFGNTDSPYSDSPYNDFGTPNIGNGSWTGEATPSAGDFWDDWKGVATLTVRASDTAGTITLTSPASNVTGQFRSYITQAGVGRWEMTDVVASTPQVFTFTISGTLPPQGTVLQYWAGVNGYQEKDLDVFGTSVRRVNNVLQPGNAGIPSGEELGADVLEDSLAYTSTPDWWTPGLPWPPYNYTQDTDPTVAIPAERRFLGIGGPGSITCVTLNVTTLTLG